MSNARTSTSKAATNPDDVSPWDDGEIDRDAPSGLSRKSFQDRVEALLESLAERDPVGAARLVGDYLDDLDIELGRVARAT